jgi:hypothetical protein
MVWAWLVIWSSVGQVFDGERNETRGPRASRSAHLSQCREVGRDQISQPSNVIRDLPLIEMN